MPLPNRLGQHAPPPVDTGERHLFPCMCGLWRSLPNLVRIGDVVDLVSCPRCGSAPRLRFLGAQVEMVDPKIVPATVLQGLRVLPVPKEAPVSATPSDSPLHEDPDASA